MVSAALAAGVRLRGLSGYYMARQVGELFGKTAIGALFFYCLLRVGKSRRQSSAE